MSSVNKVTLLGNLGGDIEVKYMGNGDAVCNVNLATTDSWRDKASGEQRESTEWHRLVFYRRLAEIAGQYLGKGSQVYIEGRLKTKKFTDKNGVEREKTEVEVTEMKMLGKRESAGSSKPTATKSAMAAQAPSDLDDDIPF